MKKNDRRKRKLQEEACDYEIERTPTTRYEPDYEEGLTSTQAEEHRRDGWGNVSVDPPAQTTEEIIKENVFTYFNLIFLVLAILLTIVGSFRNLTFLPVIIFNTLIGIIQEIRSKKTLEKLNMLNAPHATVVRDGKTSRVNSESLVLDDIVIFKAGNQVCADAEVVHGSVQVNESLLTGESDEITKNPGDHLMSGSFIVAGECHARLDAVGVDSYISKLTLEAKAMQKGEQSEMIRSLDKLVKFVGIALIPIGIILFVQSFFFNGDPFRSSITSMVAAVIGMIPEGLYLLASVAMAVSAMRLAKQKVLLHDMKSIETLARVNVLCVDKTGTITETNMSVKDVVPTSNYKKDEMPELPKMLGDFAKAMSSDNITMEALKEYFKEGTGKKAGSVTPFTSATKYSGVTYEEEVHVLGAPEFVLRDDFDEYKEEIEGYAGKGNRVLVFGTYDGELDGKALTGKVTPLGYVLLANPIRKEAPETFSYFAEQGVEVKVISGDNPLTVSEVAKEAGIANADRYVDAATLHSDAEIADAVANYTVFGRVTPDQKRKFVHALKDQGKTVAMTGDGVNDAPALKQADIGVAMGITGTEVAKDAAGMVLADDNFATIVKAVKNGRNVYANIKRAVQFLLSGNTAGILTVLYASLMGLPVPFSAVHLLFINLLTDSLPAIALGLEPHTDEVMREKPCPRNEDILTKPFLLSVSMEGLVIAAATITAFYLGLSYGGAAAGQTMAFSTLCLSRLFHSFSCKSQHPVLLTRKFWNNRALLGAFAAGSLLLGLVLLVPALEPLFSVAPLSVGMVGAIVGLAFGSMLVIQLLKWIRR